MTEDRGQMTILQNMRCLIIVLILLIAGTGNPANSSAASNVYFLSTIDRFSDEYPFEGLSAVFVYNEELYVADNAGSRIYIFDLDGIPLFQFGKEKGLARPVDLVVLNNRIYVSQEGTETIEIFNMRGDNIGKVDPPFKGFSPGKMTPIEGRGFFAVDKITLKVCAFDNNGKYQYNFGGRDVFRSMGGIAVWKGRVYITVMDSMPLIRVFDLKGNYQTGFGRIGDSKEFFSMPAGVNVDNEGIIWVVDAFRHKVSAYNQEGRKQNEFGGSGRFLGSLDYPQDIEISGDRFYVLEKGRNRISLFIKKK